MIQAQTRGQVLEGVQQYGLAPGARKMIDAEEAAADMAMETGIYGVWRSSKGMDCTRIGPSARCFCNHSYADHYFVSSKAPFPICKACSCRGFAFIPSRPEEIGEWWLPRRKGFNVHTWRAKCRCGHGHDEHDPNARRCRCGCPAFQSNFACLVCDMKWEDHETVFETAQERLMAGRPVGDDFRPLADDRAIRDMVFPEELGAATPDSFAPSSIRRPQVPASRGEKSVRIMAASSGGAVADQEVANRWGKVTNPPQWPPALGSGPQQLPQLSGGAGAGGSSVVRRPGPGAGVSRGPPSLAAGSASTDRSRQGAAVGSWAVSGSAGAAPARPGSVGRPLGAAGSAPAGARGGARSAATSQSAVGLGGGGGAASGPKQLSSGFRPVYD